MPGALPGPIRAAVAGDGAFPVVLVVVVRAIERLSVPPRALKCRAGQVG